MNSLLQDLRYAGRQLLKRPGFTIVAVLTLALGIGATSAIFSVVYAVLVKPYPYARPGEIWVPGTRSASSPQIMRPFRHAEFEAMAALPAIEDMMGTTPDSALLSGEFAVESLTAPRLTANAFRFIGVPPWLGRTFGSGDFSRSGVPEPVTVISFNLWQRLFGGDPKVLGRTLRLDDNLYTIVGVMPSHFGWWTIDGLWLPMARVSGAPGRVFPICRLKPGVEASAARQQFQAAEVELAKINPDDFPKETFDATLTNYLDLTVASGEMQRALYLLFGAVAFLLLIACANIANLQLARATGRMKEMAIRLAIGARRGRLVRQLLTENILLSGLGAVAGLVFCVALTRLMVALMPGFNIPAEARIEVNGPVLLFSVAVALVTGVAFGLAPTLQSTRPNLTGALKDERTAGPVRGGAMRSSLIVAEMALSVVLLVSAGLTIRSFLALKSVALGFRPEHVVTADVTFPPSRYTTFEQRNRFAEELLDRLERLPDAQAAEIGNGGLPFDGFQSGYSIDGQAGPDGKPLTFDLVSAGYLRTMGIALARGRMLDQDDIRRGDQLAVINESAAKLWPAGEDPVGRQIHVDLLKGSFGPVLVRSNAVPEVTVIGVCADTRNNGLAKETLPTAFLPFTVVAPRGRTVAVRSSLDTASIINAIRAEVKAIDPLLPVRNAGAVERALSQQTAQPRFMMALFSLFAAVGLTLATVGLFSVLSYLVARRSREIGVRMALGAQRADVLKLVLKDGGRLAALGIFVGTLGSLAAVRLVGSQVDLFQVGSIDPVSFGAVIALLAVVALAACWFPARRAASVNPAEALRGE
jgi:predicted permease